MVLMWTGSACSGSIQGEGDGQSLDVDGGDGIALDVDCTGVSCVNRCYNGHDDDGDGITDCADPDCSDDPVCEPGFEKSCDDDIDNDGDGVTDCNDSNCGNVGDCGPWGEKFCDDGVDNDGDGKTDCDDSDCQTCNGQCCPDGFSCQGNKCRIDCPEGLAQCGEDDDVCCAAGESCILNTCLVPTGECETSADCELGEICEPVAGRCVPEGSVDICEYVPPVGVLKPSIGCRWEPPEGSNEEGRNNVVMNPVVANLTDDNGDGLTNVLDMPDVAFVAWDKATGGCCDEPATLWIMSGKCNADGTATTIAEVPSPDLDESGGLAVGDITGDGVPEIVAMKLINGSIAFTRKTPDGSEWEILWENDEYPTRDVHTRGGTQPGLANLDGQGAPEVYVGNAVLDGLTGELKWDGVITSNGEGGIGNNAFLGPVSIAADIDLDNKMELIAGNTVYDGATGVPKCTYEFTSEDDALGGVCDGNLPCDGFDGTGNFDDDPEGEIVIVRRGVIYILEHDCTPKHKIEIPWEDCFKDGGRGNESGPPTVADFDGDGRPEIGTAGADYYVVADLDCVGDPLPEGCESEYILWTVPNEDCSSRATASSVFDFEGDGKAEVVYADEDTFRILDGSTGAELYVDTSHGSNTRLEMPVVADVDNDGNAEVVIPENHNNGGTPGVEIWRDEDNNWVRSRRIWNQHSYHISNVTEDGEIPTYEVPNWLDEKQNNFRQNVQPTGVFYAPDLQVERMELECGNQMTVEACVANDGALAAAPGVSMVLTITVEGSEPEQVALDVTTVEIAPAQDCTPIQFVFTPPTQVFQGLPFTMHFSVDDDGTGKGQLNECIEDNNSFELKGICAS